MFYEKNKSSLLIMQITTIKIFVYLLLFVSNLSLLIAQSTYEPVYNKDIYSFLDKQADKELITFFDDIRPVSREKIARYLLRLSNNTDKLTPIEKEQLEFFKNEYAFEIKFIEKDTTTISEFMRFSPTERINFYKYYSQDFTFTLDPIVGIDYNFYNKTYHQYGGVEFYGRIDENWGYYFNYRDNTETGKKLDRKKVFSNQTGVNVLRSKPTLIDYSETRGGISYGWKTGNITAAKDFLHIGSSSLSSVILSDKVPSFPYIRIDFHPTGWFIYNFVHAWLDSDLIDSTTIRNTGVTSTLLKRGKSYSRLQKYYVAHSISFQPFEDLWLTFGESIIYGDRLELIYFLPVFYRLADHYNMIGGGDTGDNAQLFFNTSYIWSNIQSKFYMSFLIDEFSPSELFSEGDNAQVFSITLGGVFTNPLWNDNYITLEYNAIRPYIGMNADPLHTYESSSYHLGHWIGSNAVQLYLGMEQYFPYMINAKAFFNYVIKGEKEDINNYYNRVTSTYPLLSGVNSYFSEFGFSVRYSPINNLSFNVDYSYIFKATNRFKNEFAKKSGSYFITSFKFGI